MLLPDGKILGGDGELSKLEHIATRFGQSSSLSPYDLGDRRFKQCMCPGLCQRLGSRFGSSEFGSDLGQRRSRRGKFARCQRFIANDKTLPVSRAHLRVVQGKRRSGKYG
jgi:hypothetical protein